MDSNSDDRRRRPRISTMILCEIRIGEQPPEVVRIRDLSETGIKIASARMLLIGDRLRVRLLGSTDWCLARVTWCSKGVAGLAFTRAIDLPRIVDARPSGLLRQQTTPLPAKRFAG